MSLKSIVLTTKVVSVEFPGLKGFTVNVGAITREVSKKLREESEVSRLDPKLRMPVKELDENIFLDKFTKMAIKGWTGLTYEHLSKLMLIDLDQVKDITEEVEYSEENAVVLMKNSVTFDSWINETVFSLDAFRN